VARVNPAAALMAALAALRTEPLRETAWRLVVGIHLAQGNLGAGRQAYEEYRALLWDELRVEPSGLYDSPHCAIDASGVAFEALTCSGRRRW
jgi:hypothetical protein